MALYQRGQIWYVDFYVNGKRVQESTRTRNKRAAEKFYALRLSEVQRGVYAKPVKVLLDDLGARYLQHAKTHKRSWLRDEQILVHLRDFFGRATLQQIAPLRIEEYQQARILKVSPATVNREVALLKHMINLAEKWSLFRGRNPVKDVRFLREDNSEVRSLSLDEESALLKCCSPYLQDLVVFAINTGLRFGDILSLRWKEVDLDSGMLRRVARKNRRMLELPLNEQAEAVLRAWLGIRKCDSVFYNPQTGAPFKDLWLGLKKACRKAGLEDVTWHTFRHTFATRLTRRGADLVTVKELLGHSSISVTMRYAHSNRDSKERAVQLLDGDSDKVVTIDKKKRKKA